MNNDEYFMKKALEQAKIASNEDEVPVGAVIVQNGRIISTGRNRREKLNNALLHAEIECINNACKILGSWRLWQCEIFVTLEPCPMCTGAIINARIPKLVFGAKDSKSGSCGSVINLFDLSYNHKPDITNGILEKECSDIMTDFFKKIRVSKKNL